MFVWYTCSTTKYTEKEANIIEHELVLDIICLIISTKWLLKHILSYICTALVLSMSWNKNKCLICCPQLQTTYIFNYFGSKLSIFTLSNQAT